MNITINYKADIITVNNMKFSLGELRTFIMERWPTLALAHKIKSIEVGDGMMMTFDWARILGLAVEGSIIIEDFLKSKNAFAPSRRPLLQGQLF